MYLPTDLVTVLGTIYRVLIAQTDADPHDPMAIGARAAISDLYWAASGYSGYAVILNA